MAENNDCTLDSALRQLTVAFVDRSIADAEFCRLALRGISAALNVDRVGAWRFNLLHRILNCVDMHRRVGQASAQPLAISAHQAPDYFKKLAQFSQIAAPDAAATPEMGELTSCYLRPNGILSKLDVRIPSASGALGILSLETIDIRHAWRADECVFASAVAGLIAARWEMRETVAARMEIERSTVELQQVQTRFNDLIRNAPGAFFQYLVAPCGQPSLEYISEGCRDLWGMEPKSYLTDPQKLWRSVDPGDYTRIQRLLKESQRTFQPFSAKWRTPTRFGRTKWLLAHAIPRRHEQGGVLFNGQISDISERVAHEAELARMRREAELTTHRFISAIEALPDGFVIYDKDDRLVICNEQYKRAYAGVADLIYPGQKFENLIRASVERGLHPAANGREEEWVAERMQEHVNPTRAIEQQLGEDRHLQIHESRTANGDIVGFRVDVTQLKRQQRRLEELAHELEHARRDAEHEALHDPLTGLPNRRHLDRKLAELSEAQGDDELFALHVDLDRFKQINDTLGHAAGDYVLQVAAATLRRSVRHSDFVARIGGDEFVVLCPDGADEKVAWGIAQRIIDQFSTPIDVAGSVCRFGASVGVASAPISRAAELLVNADIALYKAKSGGRNRVEVYTSALQHALVAQKQRSDELLSALEAGEIGAYFQPQFNASDLEYVGLEALARWEHPERGVLPPCAFFDIAEELQIVDEIDRVVMAKAAEMCRVLAAAGISTPKIAVNVSCDRLKRDLIYEDVANFDAAGAQLAFELLETIYVEGDEDLDSSIQRLRRLGVEFEVDDFGSGRASILSLLHVTPRRLKIDRALIEPIVESPKHLQVVRAIVEIGRSQGVSVTAEGVETEAHVEILRDLGCDTLQGYYFSAPMSPERLTRYLQTRQWLKAS